MELQTEIKNQIDQIEKNNTNEKLITKFKEKINQQQVLYNKYFEMREEINDKIKAYKETMPELKERVRINNEKFKEISKENLKLMEQISELEKGGAQDITLLNKNTNVSSIINNSVTNSMVLGNPNVSTSQDVVPNKSSILNNSANINADKLQNSINIKEIVDENENIRSQYNRVLTLKKQLKMKKKENETLSKEITKINTDCFVFKKIFTEGMHEIAKELLKIHELQLDKVISSNSMKGNNLYFEIVKGNVNGNEIKNDSDLKLPIINSNIKRKYNYPIIEKSNPNGLVYKVIKNMLEENNNLNKLVNMKKNKFEWDEFKEFSAYQMYTLLNMNKDIIKKIEANLFPRKLIIPTEDQNKSFNSFEEDF
ncbi:MAG: hypothetical protein MJ252_25490 [archaeon]|nr:hypothetical protein [archaeon]